MYKKSEERGITLIALIITIIVLLILTGISIATLSGDNGILTKANDAVQQNKIGTDKEAIILAYNAAMLENQGEAVTAEDLNDEFAINGVNATASGTDPITVVIGERTYTIGANGTITEGETEDSGSSIVEGTREDWEVTDDGTITLFKGTVPADGTLVIPNVVDGIEIKKLVSANSMDSIVYDADVAVEQSLYSDKVKKVIVSEGIETIGLSAFAYTVNLESITMPNTVMTIRASAFIGCAKLATVNYTGTQEEWDAISIDPFENEPLTNANIVYNYGN